MVIGAFSAILAAFNVLLSVIPGAAGVCHHNGENKSGDCGAGQHTGNAVYAQDQAHDDGGGYRHDSGSDHFPLGGTGADIHAGSVIRIRFPGHQSLDLTELAANLHHDLLGAAADRVHGEGGEQERQHAADELKTVAKAVSYLSEHGISTLAELDAALSSVSDQADAIREGMKTAEKRMKELQKLIEYGKNYTEYKPIHDELKKLKNGWTSKRDKYEEAHRAELTLWNAASRYLHANLPKGTKSLPIAEWEKEYATLSGQRTAEYTKLKETRAEVAELHNIRKCVDIALKADQPEQTRAKRYDLER